ncbi:MAG: hypothetical protein U1F53_05515 [Burkholderiaceae bacterium]
MTLPTQAPDAALVLPCTGQTLRTALQRRDLRTLDELTRHLRVAGYRFEPVHLATELLVHGCASVADAFGHRVPVHVRVPTREAPVQARDERQSFMLAL